MRRKKVRATHSLTDSFDSTASIRLTIFKKANARQNHYFFVKDFSLFVSLDFYARNTSSVQRLFRTRCRLKMFYVIKKFNNEICKEDEGNL